MLAEIRVTKLHLIIFLYMSMNTIVHWLWEIWRTWGVCLIARERKPMIRVSSYLVKVKLNYVWWSSLSRIQWN